MIGGEREGCGGLTGKEERGSGGFDGPEKRKVGGRSCCSLFNGWWRGRGERKGRVREGVP